MNKFFNQSIHFSNTKRELLSLYGVKTPCITLIIFIIWRLSLQIILTPLKTTHSLKSCITVLRMQLTSLRIIVTRWKGRILKNLLMNKFSMNLYLNILKRKLLITVCKEVKDCSKRHNLKLLSSERFKILSIWSKFLEKYMLFPLLFLFFYIISFFLVP